MLAMLLILNSFAFAHVVSKDGKAATQHKIQVGVVMEMPFAQNLEGHYSGIAVDLWERIAKENHWDYTFIPLGENAESNLNRLATESTLDIIIGPISVTSARLEKVDFTRPFYLSSIGVITEKHEVGLRDILRMLLSKNLMHVIMILIAVFIGYLSLLWLFERNKPEEVVKRGYYTTLTQRIWLHLFQKKVDYMPVTSKGRIIGIFWIIFAATTFAAINANFTSALTIARYENDSATATLAGLQSTRVAGVEGQLNVEVAEKNGIDVELVSNLEQAVSLLKKGQVDGVVCDTPVGVDYLRRKRLARYTMSPVILENDELAFAVKLNSPYRHKIDIGITSYQDDDSVIELCKRYVGEEAQQCDM